MVLLFLDVEDVSNEQFVSIFPTRSCVIGLLSTRIAVFTLFGIVAHTVVIKLFLNVVQQVR